MVETSGQISRADLTIAVPSWQVRWIVTSLDSARERSQSPFGLTAKRSMSIWIDDEKVYCTSTLKGLKDIKKLLEQCLTNLPA
jgi:hypothetical protein